MFNRKPIQYYTIMKKLKKIQFTRLIIRAGGRDCVQDRWQVVLTLTQKHRVWSSS